MREIRLTPIGIVRVKESEDSVRNSRGVPGRIEIFEDYIKGLIGIEGFSHIMLLAYLDKVTEQQRGTLMVKPKRFIRLGISPENIPTVGVFSTDSPHRPNPIAITIVRLLKVEGRELHVDGLDLFDGTPIIDIKPYTESRVFRELKFPRWYSDLLEQIKEKTGTIIEP
ncbi:MAG: tRNA (N6-threonylcarbamoyladenosine(37)-N6)-methyltransferase TrmO [Candidatus Methanomethylicaceae archaeon]